MTVVVLVHMQQKQHSVILFICTCNKIVRTRYHGVPFFTNFNIALCVRQGGGNCAVKQVRVPTGLNYPPFLILHDTAFSAGCTGAGCI